MRVEGELCVYDKSEVHTCKNYSSFEIVPVVKRAKRTIYEMTTTASSKIKAAHNCRGISLFHLLSQNSYPVHAKWLRPLARTLDGCRSLFPPLQFLPHELSSAWASAAAL